MEKRFVICGRICDPSPTTSRPFAAALTSWARYASAMGVGITHLYRLEHDEAIRFFSELEKDYPSHPGPPLALAMATWVRELFSREELDLEKYPSAQHTLN